MYPSIAEGREEELDPKAHDLDLVEEGVDLCGGSGREQQRRRRERVSESG
jgi:aspartyl-tRNA synthetase